MNTYLKIGVVVALLAVVAAVIVAKAQRKDSPTDAAPVAKVADPRATTLSAAAAALPRLVDLGAHSCIPCKKMAPILEELGKEYDGRLRVEFIDVWQNPDAGQKYGIRLIPTQIFYNASGKELARHEGFMSKEDILAQWTASGVSLAAPPARQE